MDLELTVGANAANPVVHDLHIVNGQVALLDDIEAIAQHLRIRLQFFLGEWFLDLREGVPFFRSVFARVRSRTVVRSVLRQVVIGTPGIAQVSEFDFEYDGLSRQASLNFEAVTDTGLILSSEDFGQFIVEV